MVVVMMIIIPVTTTITKRRQKLPSACRGMPRLCLRQDRLVTRFADEIPTHYLSPPVEITGLGLKYRKSLFRTISSNECAYR